MKMNSIARAMVALVCLALLSAAGCPVAYAASEVRFQLVRDALIIVPVTVDGEGPFYFVLDTGADTTILDLGLAKRLSLLTLQSAREVTIANSRAVNVSRVPRLRLGAALVEGLPVLEEDLSSLRRMDGRIAGVVGQDFLSRFDYLLDYRARSFRIEEGHEIQDGIRGDPLLLESGHTRMIVAAEADARGHATLRLLLDSGANALVLMGPASNDLHCRIVEQGVESSAGGAVILGMARVDLRVASYEFRDLPVSLVAGDSSPGIEDGLLPTALFERLYVSNSRRFVILNPHVRKDADVRVHREEIALDRARN